jgi:pimeloyl-ACP methyl ester carboxylesterase
MSATVGTRVEVGGGRTLMVYDAGDPEGVPILFHHGTPSSGAPFEPHVRLAEEQGVRLVSYDRAGYGESARDAGRDIAAVAADAASIADALGIDRFATWGLSGGGPHALACAALLPERVAAVASAAGVAPFGVEGLDWLAGMGEANVQEFGAALAGEETLRPALEAEAAGLASATTEEVIEAMSTLLSGPDVAACKGGLGEWVLAGFRIGLGHGVEGWVDDDLAFTRPWGFEPAEIERPALVVQGRQDFMVPGGHGEWLASRIPGAEAWFSEEEGHLTLFQPESVRRIHEWLLERL